MRAPPLLLNAGLTLGMELVEADRRPEVGGGKDLYRNVDQAYLR